MPELPEVETTLRGILPHIKKQKITNVAIRHTHLRWPIPSHIKATIIGKSVLEIERRGKYLLFKFSNGTMIIHLGMSGHLRILATDLPPTKHDHVDICFANHKMLRFNDPRRFGALLWVDGDPLIHPLLKHLGVEPLSAQFSARYLLGKAQSRSTAIKTFLMDHHVVTGVGNIYATEALFAAGIHPTSMAKSIDLNQLKKLVIAVKKILREAIKQGGTTLKDFMKSDGKPGYFSNHLNVYGRAGLPCYRCRHPLKQIRQSQRGTVYCENCQQF